MFKTAPHSAHRRLLTAHSFDGEDHDDDHDHDYDYEYDCGYECYSLFTDH